MLLGLKIQPGSLLSTIPALVVFCAIDEWKTTEFCGTDQFQDGLHLLTAKANVSNQQTFWFDQIQFAPSVTGSISLNQMLVNIDSRRKRLDNSV